MKETTKTCQSTFKSNTSVRLYNELKRNKNSRTSTAAVWKPRRSKTRTYTHSTPSSWGENTNYCKIQFHAAAFELSVFNKNTVCPLRADDDLILCSVSMKTICSAINILLVVSLRIMGEKMSVKNDSHCDQSRVNYTHMRGWDYFRLFWALMAFF